MIGVKVKGDFNNIERFFNVVLRKNYLNILDKYGKIGVDILSQYTPVDTGKTAASWDYSIVEEQGITKLIFSNSNVVKHVNIAIILQYGHATRNGGWVKGVDYINPALEPVFENLAKELWQEVTE